MGCSGLRAIQVAEACVEKVIEGGCKESAVFGSDGCRCLEQCAEDRKFVRRLFDKTRFAERCRARASGGGP